MAGGVARGAVGVGLAALAVLGLGVAIVAAGTPARGTVVADSTEILNSPAGGVDPSTLPPLTVGQDVIDFDPQLGGAGIRPVLVTLAQNLELENQALLRHDPPSSRRSTTAIG